MLEVHGSKKEWTWWISLAIGRFLLAMFVISILTFLLIYMTPGDPAANYLRASGIPYSASAAAAVREQLGLNQPPFLQYIHWLWQALHGDLGISFMTRGSVLGALTKASLHTLSLTLVSMVWLIVGSIGLAIWCIKRPGGIVDMMVQGFSLIAVSFPNYFLAYLLILLFAATLHWFPVSGMSGSNAVILPSVALVMPMLGQTTLFLRKCFLSYLEEMHTKNAVLRGVTFRFLVQNHVLRNGMAAIVTIISWNFLALLTGSIIIENVFAWPGIGSLFVKAAQNGDTTVIQGTLLLFGLLAMIVNTATQLLIKWLDPRQRHQKVGDGI